MRGSGVTDTVKNCFFEVFISFLYIDAFHFLQVSKSVHLFLFKELFHLKQGKTVIMSQLILPPPPPQVTYICATLSTRHRTFTQLLNSNTSTATTYEQFSSFLVLLFFSSLSLFFFFFKVSATSSRPQSDMALHPSTVAVYRIIGLLFSVKASLVFQFFITDNGNKSMTVI